MAQQTPHPMGRRQQARAKQRKRRRVIALSSLLLLIFLVLFIIWLKRESRTGSNAPDPSTTPVESEAESSYDPSISIPIEEESEEPSESIVVITELPTETPEESAEPTETAEEITDNQGSAENKENTGDKGSAGNKETTGNKGSNGKKGTTGNKTSTGNQSANNKTNTGTTNGTGTDTSTGGQTVVTPTSPEPSVEPSTEPSPEPSAEPSTPAVTLDAVTLTVNVANPLSITKGDTATLSWTAKDSEGNDVTEQCAVSFITENCTVEGTTVTFTEVGTATIQASVTYDGTTKTSGKLSYQVNEPPVVVLPVLTTVTLGALESTYNQGEYVTLSAAAADQNGNAMSSGVTFTYSVTGAVLDEETSTVTFDQWGTVTITVTGTQGDTSVTSEAVTIAVLPKVGDTVLSQQISDKTFGFSVYLPEAAEAKKNDENGENTEPTTYEVKENDTVVLSAVLTGADRAEDDKASLEDAMNAAKAALNVSDENAILNGEKGYYDLTYIDGDNTVLVRCYLGDKASNTLTITYTGDRKELATGILNTFQPGDLTTTHEAAAEEN